MSKKYRKGQRLIKRRRWIRKVRRRWEKYGCSCVYHNMRGNK